MQTVSPENARKLLAEGAVLVDIREADEHARERIPGATSAPLSRLGESRFEGPAPVIFHCKTGNRTATNAERLKGAAACEAYLLEGGLEGWKKAGLPVATDTRRPIEINRQVQIAAGGLVVLGAVLGYSVDPLFHLMSGFVGAGLVFAGASGTCAMASLLARAPWNRAPAAGR